MSHHTKSAHSFPTIQVGDKDRPELPSSNREALDLQSGDRLVKTVETPAAVRLSSAREIARRGRGILGSKKADHDLAGELIAERREEAERD